MDFSRIFHAVNADEAETGTYGYFANNIEDLEKAIKNERTGLHVMYAQLEAVLPGKAERRFSCYLGNFSLFYPFENRYNSNRY